MYSNKAKELTEKLPSELKTDLSFGDMNEMKDKLAKLGCELNITS